jgi:uncharacterized cupredoxin-like copper-binding protein
VRWRADSRLALSRLCSRLCSQAAAAVGQAGPLQAENPPAQLKLLPQENRPLARPLAAGGKYGSSSSATTTMSKGVSGGTLKTIVIKETEMKLSPSTVTLSKPGTYSFKAENKGSIEHSLEIEGNGVRSKGDEVGEAKLEKTLNPGQSDVLTVTFRAPATYEMYCPVIGHRLAGMKGEVVVK